MKTAAEQVAALEQTIAEAKAATRQLHEALVTFKAQRADVDRYLTVAVEKAVADACERITAQLHEEASEAVTRFERDLRARLQLEA